MRRQLIAAVRVFVVLTVVTGVVYPAVVTGLSQLVFHGRADGSLVRSDGRVVGSALLGQAFTGPEWFHPRPGAYDPLASDPSNLGPTSPDLEEQVAARSNALGRGTLPADAVYGSASGLDPHITPAYARRQAPRVARERRQPLDEVLALIREHTDDRTWGFLGEPRVNVLQLNLALEG